MNILSSTLGAAAILLSGAALADYTGALGTVAQVSQVRQFAQKNPCFSRQPPNEINVL